MSLCRVGRLKRQSEVDEGDWATRIRACSLRDGVSAENVRFLTLSNDSAKSRRSRAHPRKGRHPVCRDERLAATAGYDLGAESLDPRSDLRNGDRRHLDASPPACGTPALEPQDSEERHERGDPVLDARVVDPPDGARVGPHRPPRRDCPSALNGPACHVSRVAGAGLGRSARFASAGRSLR